MKISPPPPTPAGANDENNDYAEDNYDDNYEVEDADDHYLMTSNDIKYDDGDNDNLR